MQVQAAANIHAARSAYGPQAAGRPEPTPPSQLNPVDELQLSAEAQTASETGEARAAKLAGIKAEIQAGTYDTPERMEAALDRFLDSFA